MTTKSTNTGSNHWWFQRVTAILLVPLGLWFMTTILGIAHLPISDIMVFWQNPLMGILWLCLVLTVAFHAYLGIQVVIEDYIHGLVIKTLLLISIKIAALLFVIVNVVSILKLMLGA